MLKLIDWDKYEAVYSWKGLLVVGREYDSDTFRWSFPEIDGFRALNKRIDWSHILNKYEIPRYGEPLQKHLEGECKEELEKELEKELKDPLNQKVLLMMVLDDVVIFDK